MSPKNVPNPLFVSRMERLVHHLPHFPPERILRHDVPESRSDTFQEMLRNVSGATNDVDVENGIRAPKVYCSPGRDLHTQRMIASRLSASLRKRNGIPLCTICWLTVDCCGCKNLVPVVHSQSETEKEGTAVESASFALPVPLETVEAALNGKCSHVRYRFRFVVYMHHHELLRSSNSAKLLLALLPGADILVAGIADDERRLESQYLKESGPNAKESTVVLYPSESAVTFAELIRKMESKEVREEVVEEKDKSGDLEGQGQLQQEQESEEEIEEHTFNIVLLDGTWSNARTLARRIPQHVQRVRLTTIDGYVTLFNELRKMGSERQAVGRVSTYEAAVLAMRELGQNEQLIGGLLDNLKHMINHVLYLNRRPPVTHWPGEEKLAVKSGA